LTKAYTFDATTQQDKSGHQATSGVKVEDTATDGKKTVFTLGDTARLGPTSQLSVVRSFGFNSLVQDKGETYTVTNDKDGRKLETSYARTLSDKQAEHSSSNIFGLTGDLNDKWAANASLAQGQVLNPDGTKTDRVAFSGGVGYLEKDKETNEQKLASSTKAEVRLDSGVVDKSQYVFMHSTDGKVTDETTLTGKFSWSQTKNKDTNSVEAQYKEIILGAAYRPIANDRLNVFGRYTYKMNQSPQGQLNTTDILGQPTPTNALDQSASDVQNTTMQVLTVEGAYDLNDDWQVVERLAYRIMEEKVIGFDFNTTHTWLLVNRLNYRIGKDWKIGGEYRVLTQREAKDQKRGAMVEAVRSVNDNLEMGVGYNFTDFADDLTNLDYTVAGPFIRMTGKLYDRTPEERARARAKWLDRRVQAYATKMVEDEFKKKDSPVVLELNQMYRMAQVAAEKEDYEQSKKIYKDIVLATDMMFEEAAQFVRKHISFEEKLFNAHQRALEYYDRGDYWMAKKIWEKIVEEASKAVVE
jgi:tetratricopeptide (TPR) repeat protein